MHAEIEDGLTFLQVATREQDEKSLKTANTEEGYRNMGAPSDPCTCSHALMACQIRLKDRQMKARNVKKKNARKHWTCSGRSRVSLRCRAQAEMASPSMEEALTWSPSPSGHVCDVAVSSPKLKGNEQGSQQCDEPTANCLNDVGQLPALRIVTDGITPRTP